MEKSFRAGRQAHSGGVNKTDIAYAAQDEMLNFNPLFSSDELKLQTTPKAVT